MPANPYSNYQRDSMLNFQTMNQCHLRCLFFSDFDEETLAAAVACWRRSGMCHCDAASAELHCGLTSVCVLLLIFLLYLCASKPINLHQFQKPRLYYLRSTHKAMYKHRFIKIECVRFRHRRRCSPKTSIPWLPRRRRRRREHYPFQRTILPSFSISTYLLLSINYITRV